MGDLRVSKIDKELNSLVRSPVVTTHAILEYL